MGIRRAVILAAGTVSSHGGFTTDPPGPLLEIGGHPLVDRQLAVLDACGVRHTTVVVAGADERLRRHLGTRATVVHCDRTLEPNSLFSLWLAAERLDGGSFVLDAGLVVTPHLLMRLKWHQAPDALVYDPRRALGPASTKVRLAGPYVIDIGPDIAEGTAAGEHVGLLKLGRDGAFRLMEILGRRVAAGEVNTGAAQAIADLARRWPIEGLDAGGLPWTAVDGAVGLQYAREVVAPVIDRSLGGSWRRTAGDMTDSAARVAGALEG